MLKRWLYDGHVMGVLLCMPSDPCVQVEGTWGQAGECVDNGKYESDNSSMIILVSQDDDDDVMVKKKNMIVNVMVSLKLSKREKEKTNIVWRDNKP